MFKQRHRVRGARNLSGTSSARRWRINTYVLAGSFLLLGSVALLQFRLALVGDPAGFSIDEAERLSGNHTDDAPSRLDSLERVQDVHDKRKVLLEGEEKSEWGKRVHGQRVRIVDNERESNFEDEVEIESRLTDALGNADEEEVERLEDVEIEMDMEDEDVDELESFGGVGEWANEVDEFSAKKHPENVAELEGKVNAGRKPERGGGGNDYLEGEERAMEMGYRGIKRRSGKETPTDRNRKSLGRSWEVNEPFEPKKNTLTFLGDETRNPPAESDGTVVGSSHAHEDPSDLWKEGSDSEGSGELAKVNALTSKKAVGVNRESFLLRTTPQTSKPKTTVRPNSNLHLRGRSDVNKPDDMPGARRLENGAEVSTSLNVERDSSKRVPNTDNDSVNEETSQRMERMVNSVDEKPASHNDNPDTVPSETKTHGKSWKKENNHSLLQDPETMDSVGLSKSDRMLLKARRQSNLSAGSLSRDDSAHPTNHLEDTEQSSRSDSNGPADFEIGQQTPSVVTSENHLGNVETSRNYSVQDVKSTSEGLLTTVNTNRQPNIEEKSLNANSRKEIELGVRRTDDNEFKLKRLPSAISEDNPRNSKDGKKVEKRVKRLQGDADYRRWGNFPGINPRLSFSAFVEEFSFDKKCSIRIFMAWTTAPWSFTVRHQRVLESIFHFHPDSCVVVFSESIELDFFKSFVEDGYRVAVAMPNLDELLKDTPTDIFTSIWLKWRKVKLFYIHYPELLRLAALYKYGGIYLDMDMILLKPLTSLRSTIGSEVSPNGHHRLNGAAMFFDRFSPFLNACMVEFTATYDETLEDGNGAALLDRVVNAPLRNGGLTQEVRSSFHVLPHMAFFPISSKNITSYFAAPKDDAMRIEHEELLDKILEESFAVHLWNRLTSKLIPEPGSLVEKIMERNCLRCTDIL